MEAKQPELEPRDPPRSESMIEEELRPTARKQRTFKYDPCQDLLERPANITFGQLIDISPAAKSIIKQGLQNIKPSYVNIAHQEAANTPPVTPAYATCEIAKRIISGLVDTGASISLMSFALMELLGMKIDRAPRAPFLTANGSPSMPLGIIEDVAVTFGTLTITVDMVVTEAASYDVILGMDWLTRANAKVDLGKKEMTIIKHGQRIRVPLDTARGARAAISEVDSDEDPDDQVNMVYPQFYHDLDERTYEWRQFIQMNGNKKFQFPKYRTPIREEW